MKKWCLKWVMASVLLLMGSAANASLMLNVDSNGQLLGASGLDIEGELFNVQFLEGRCFDLFNECNEPSDFVFNTFEEAQAAANFLADFVLLDGALGAFDSNTSLTNGCDSTILCSLLIPPPTSGFFFNPITVTNFANPSIANRVTVSVNSITAFTSTFPTDSNPLRNFDVFAVFSRVEQPSTDVPEPSALSVFAIGLFGLLWRRNKWS